jgi:hypothetical protein
MKSLRVLLPAGIALAVIFTSCEKKQDFHTVVTDFEDLNLVADTFWNGLDGSGGFISGNVFCHNAFTDFGGGITYWSGFAYSNITDNQTAGFGNQYSAYPGGGADDSKIYVIGYDVDTLTFTEPMKSVKLSVANDTYPALSMKNGDAFSKKFGGDSGNDPDWFKLTINAMNNAGSVIGTAEIMLADYTSSDNSKDYISNVWNEIDLSSFGEIKSFAFSLSSSDNGDYGMNTPAYFCLDNITGTVQN